MIKINLSEVFFDSQHGGCAFLHRINLGNKPRRSYVQLYVRGITRML